jgi:hypothetical protein
MFNCVLTASQHFQVSVIDFASGPVSGLCIRARLQSRAATHPVARLVAKPRNFPISGNRLQLQFERIPMWAGPLDCRRRAFKGKLGCQTKLDNDQCSTYLSGSQNEPTLHIQAHSSRLHRLGLPVCNDLSDFDGSRREDRHHICSGSSYARDHLPPAHYRWTRGHTS